ncbi:MAG: sulfite exporter TauE/SafE family protein [Nitrospirota bacterium]
MGIEFNSFQAIYIGVTILLTALIKTSFGVGGGIFMTAAFSLILPPKSAVGLGGPIMLLTNIMPMIHYWKNINKSVLLTIASGSIIGVIVGGVIMNYTPDRWFARMVGFFCGIFAVHQLVKNHPIPYFKMISKKVENYQYQKWHGVLFGFLGGIVTVIAHSGGVIYAIYMISINLTPSTFVKYQLYSPPRYQIYSPLFPG